MPKILGIGIDSPQGFMKLCLLQIVVILTLIKLIIMRNISTLILGPPLAKTSWTSRKKNIERFEEIYTGKQT